jgi:hypothetical protein
MEVLEIFFTAINSHIGDILTGSFLLFLTIAIASVFIKNKHEYDAIVSDLYHDKRRMTPPAIIRRKPQEIPKEEEKLEEEIEELDEYEEYMLQEGYEVETQRAITREIAAWEDVSVEQSRGKAKEQVLGKLQELERINQIMLEQNKHRFAKDVGQEISKMMQERGRMDAVINIQKNKALGVNSSQSNNKFKKLAEKGKLKPNASQGKKILKEKDEHKKEIKHEQQNAR